MTGRPVVGTSRIVSDPNSLERAGFLYNTANTLCVGTVHL